jgi:hypothetical protein
MPERVLPLLAIALTAVGCSALVNTDFSGGTEPSAANKGGQSGDTVVETGGSLPGFGGTLGEGGANDGGTANTTPEGGAGTEPSPGGSGGLGGTGVSGSGGAGGDAGEAEGGSGAGEGVGGSSGGLGGSAGTNAMGGAGTSAGGMGGGAGAGGTMAGAGMAGNAGTTAGMSGAGGKACDADLTSDPMHCGTCSTVCDANAECIDSACVSSPCDGICPTWTLATETSGGPKVDGFNSTADLCVEIAAYAPSPGYLPAYNCWNTQSRTLDANGVHLTCDMHNHKLTAATRKGGYCIHATAGDFSYAGFVLPYVASDCCTAPP